jgi:site-specific DNA-methyltransferase (adenine-specific)
VFDPVNARKHDEKNLMATKGSLARFKQQKPIVVGKNNVVIAGNGTLQAAIDLGWTEIEIKRSTLTGAEATAYALADNRTAELAEWDDDILGPQLQGLMEDGIDIAEFGFDPGDFDLGDDTEGLTDEDAVPEVPQNIHGVQRGQIWQLGDHRMMCGDSTSKDDVERLMGGEKADMVHTDPPYNVDYSNQGRPKPGKTNLGKIKNDRMADDQFLAFLGDCFKSAFDFCKNDSSIYIWYASKETMNFHAAAAAAGWDINQQIIWKKPMLLGRGRYQWAHEPCVFGVKGKPWFTDDRTKTTIWDFGGYDKSKNVHPTQKPVVVPEEAISNSSKIGSNVLDLFLGSGSTLIACEKTNRKCYGMEIDPHYCSVIIERWQQFTGKGAKLLG